MELDQILSQEETAALANRVRSFADKIESGQLFILSFSCGPVGEIEIECVDNTGAEMRLKHLELEKHKC